MFHASFGDGSNLSPWPEDGPIVNLDDIDELDAYGLVDITYGNRGTPNVRPSADGREGVAHVRRERALSEREGAVDLSWSALAPVLRVAVDEWERIRATGIGVSAEAIGEGLQQPVDLQLVRALEALRDGEWVQLEWGRDDEAHVKPTPRAFQAVRGHPGGDGEAAVQRLLLALDELVEEATSEEKRTKAEVARRTVGDFVRTAGVELAAKLAVGG